MIASTNQTGVTTLLGFPVTTARINSLRLFGKYSQRGSRRKLIWQRNLRAESPELQARSGREGAQPQVVHSLALRARIDSKAALTRYNMKIC